MAHTSMRTKAGINTSVNLNHFTEEEKNIIKRLSNEWYITHGGSTLSLGTKSSYKYFLMKPTDVYQELFNIEKELVVCFSAYEDFQPRTLDAFEAVSNKLQDLRLEKVAGILISKDEKIEKKIIDVLKCDPEYQAIVPFSYSELISNNDSYFVRNRFKEYFYTRDLFSFQSPLKKDLYFFGRTELIHKIVSRHKSNENSGLFGLRKTGKTSIIFGIQRVLKNTLLYSAFIDCQNPSFHMKRWNNALKYVIDEVKSQNNISLKLKDIDAYTEDNASTSFEKDLLKIHSKISSKSVLLIFDEVEHMSYGVSPTSHWRNDNDFILFWQTLRSVYQKHTNLFSYLIVGTNPKCVETPFINGIDNPIFSQIPYEYIPPFDVPQTREMVRKLGRIMGLKYDETIYSKLTEDFGGHPFIIRLVCSAINKLSPTERPVRIDKALYEKGKDLFTSEYGSYIEMVISVLKEYYNDEYEMLKMLAIDDVKTFNDFANLSNEYTNHLLGYNIIDKNLDVYTFKIDAIKKHLVSQNKYKKLELTDKEKIQEISDRRNEIEPKLRAIIRTTLFSKFGEIETKNKVLDVFGSPRKGKYYTYTLKDIFNPNKSEIYFEDLRKIIAKEWSSFEHIFGRDKESFNVNMNCINKYRVDSHAKNISDEEMLYFRANISKIESYIEQYL
ncbi:hypothetical protein C799_01216 [Bacteroides thetaiotaomicron dnLKV9]|uniref:ATP-binding protein n=1 Tax=Bacteroides thetaiotaomicron dnLKV9 TaxID=1235785 RepID=R9HLS3_BACT4|nr:hypothetical protein [Bacteroides thetaiotaomicron]EOS02100.1 hypothetical protein C799_01216 [Bacteroides thetaiotaomicron dnLKV9]